MKRLNCAATLACLLSLNFPMSAFAEVKLPLGDWITFDEVTEAPTSRIEITRQGDHLVGRIVSILNIKDSNTIPVCDKCIGANKGKPVEGMIVLWGVKMGTEGELSDGQLLDPRTGKTYSARLKVVNGGRSLEVRAYIGISMTGKTLTWHRF